MPLAAFAVWQRDALHLCAAWGDPEAAGQVIQAQGNEALLTHEAARALGAKAAAQLIASGARLLA